MSGTRSLFDLLPENNKTKIMQKTPKNKKKNFEEEFTGEK